MPTTARLGCSLYDHGSHAGDFWAPRAIDKLAAEQEIALVDDVDTLRDREASDEEIDRLLAALDDM